MSHYRRGDEDRRARYEVGEPPEAIPADNIPRVGHTERMDRRSPTSYLLSPPSRKGFHPVYPNTVRRGRHESLVVRRVLRRYSAHFYTFTSRDISLASELRQQILPATDRTGMRFHIHITPIVQVHHTCEGQMP